MNFITDHDRDLGCAEQSAGFNLPALPGQKCMSGRGQAGKIGHGGPGYESGGRFGRQTEKGHQPFATNFFDERCNRRSSLQNCVLIPDTGQDVCRQR